ncbi:MAG TPA: hypothetical protein EYP04_06985 [Anaerolineae bacterium]|nr:hypothetical protein [Anaerolineae bacterium]
MVIVGALVRVQSEHSQSLMAELASREGMDVMAFEDPTKIGLVIEAETLDHAHQLLNEVVRRLEGVWTVYPVYANFEELAVPVG